MAKIRLFLAQEKLVLGLEVKILGADFEYLTKVMRQKIGNEIMLFDGVNGEFVAEISAIEKKFIAARIIKKISDLKKVPDITLAFALVKNVRVDFIAAKASELGVAKFQPLTTQHSVVDKINLERFAANVKEACEQCERNDFPQICDVKKLDKFLNEEAAAEKIFILCDESGQGEMASIILPRINVEQQEIVILIGPEGGFSVAEFAKMRQLKNLHAITLGPRILRADTAMIAALTLVQEFLGDFDLKPKFN